MLNHLFSLFSYTTHSGHSFSLLRAQKDASVWQGPLGGAEDYLTSRTLRNVGVYTTDTRAVDGSHQFITLGLDAEHQLSKASSPGLWLWMFSKDAREGQKCCSKRWISTHYISDAQMYSLDILRRTRCPVRTDRWPYLELPELVSDLQEDGAK